MLPIRSATVQDAAYVGALMRTDDARECAMFGVSGFAAIEASMKYSVVCECLLIGDAPAAIFGLHVPDFMASIGTPWLLSATPVERCRIGYARTVRALVSRAFEMVDRLENIVDARYTRAISMLEWLGFTVDPEQAGFRRFWMEKN